MALVGEQEMEQQIVTLKNMETGVQEQVPVSELVGRFKL